MPLSLGVITPHPPLLIPNIGKEKNLKELINTIEALQKLEELLYLMQIKTIIIIAPPHGLPIENNFSINYFPKYKCKFEEFGDFETKLEYDADINLIYKIKEMSHKEISLYSEEYISYSIGIPLYCLTKNLKKIKIIPIYYSMKDYNDHLKLGEIIKEVSLNSTTNIAVIASGDLSHCLTKDAPAGYLETAENFDKEVIKNLKEKNLTGLMALNSDLVIQAKECGFKSIITLMGVFQNIDYDFQLLSYEYPFGIGYLTASLIPR